jgi:hypothetical protein
LRGGAGWEQNRGTEFAMALARRVSSTAFIALLTATMMAQSSPAVRLPAGFAFPVRLMKTVEAKKAKAGDRVEAEMAQELRRKNGSIAVEKGAKVVGHVMEASVRVAEQPSKLMIVFDSIECKAGKMGFRGFVRSVGVPRHSESIEDYGMGRVPTNGGRSTAPATPATAAGTAMMGGKANELDGVRVRLASGLPGKMTVLESQTRDLKLPADAELIIEVTE